MVGFSCLNLKHFVRSKRIYGEGLIKNHQCHREVIMEEQAFRQAVEDHRDVVFRIALTYLRDRADADDVAQDVFLKLLKSDTHFESWEHLRRWLIRVTINECKSLFRKPWRRVEDIESLSRFALDGAGRDQGRPIRRYAASGTIPYLHRALLLSGLLDFRNCRVTACASRDCSNAFSSRQIEAQVHPRGGRP